MNFVYQQLANMLSIPVPNVFWSDLDQGHGLQSRTRLAGAIARDQQATTAHAAPWVIRR